MIGLLRWAPAAVLGVGAALVHGVAPQRAIPLERPLDEVVPAVIDGHGFEPIEVSEAEAQVAGFSDYLLRSYELEGDEASWATVYVGYYESQTQGRTIHSPKNCLPGSGWEPLQSTTATVSVPGGADYEVNRYILQRDDERALVLYWYQGRGRVAHDEYMVKLDLLRDAAIRRRSDEALVRVVVPVTDTEEEAFQKARSFAATLIPSVERALPQ